MSKDKTPEQWVDENPRTTTLIVVGWLLVLITALTWVIHNEYTGAYDVGTAGSGCECACSSVDDRANHVGHPVP